MGELPPNCMEIDDNILKFSRFDALSQTEILNDSAKYGAQRFYFYLSLSESGSRFPEARPIEIRKEVEKQFDSNLLFARFTNKGSLLANTKNFEVANALLNVKTFFGININVKLVTDNLFSRYIIRKVNSKYSLQEIAELLEEKNQCKVYALKRFIWKDKPSRSILITVPGRISEEKVKIDWESFPLDPFIEKPLQCRQCLSYGHTQVKCPSPALCVKCGQPLLSVDESNHKIRHDVEKCIAFKCIHCNQNHRSDSSNCQEFRTNREILNLKIQKNIPVCEARRKYFNTENKKSYANAVSSSSSPSRDLGEFEDICLKFKEEFKKEINGMIEKQNKEINDLRLEFKKSSDELKEILQKIVLPESVKEIMDKEITDLQEKMEEKSRIIIERFKTEINVVGNSAAKEFNDVTNRLLSEKFELFYKAATDKVNEKLEALESDDE